MALEPQREPGVPGASSVPLQRVSDDDVPADWLREPHNDHLGEKVDRLAADYDLVNSLALRNYEGREWEYFATELAKYGMAVIAGWMRKPGVIFEKCRAKGFGLPSIGRPFTDDEVEELTGETVAKALKHFRTDVLMKHKWDYRKGAALRTYFVGQCLIRFANIYRRWYGNESRNRLEGADDAVVHDLIGPGSDDPARDATDRAVALHFLADVKNPQARRAMVLTAQGRTQAEIALELDVTEKAVERMLAYARQNRRRAV